MTHSLTRHNLIDSHIFLGQIFVFVKITDEEMKEAFKMFDRDNSGTINHNEIKWFNPIYLSDIVNM